jgi:hypothetical protein
VSPQKREQSGMTDAYAAVLIDGNTTEVPCPSTLLSVLC